MTDVQKEIPIKLAQRGSSDVVSVSTEISDLSFNSFIKSSRSFSLMILLVKIIGEPKLYYRTPVKIVF